jgi:regulation of enolase protein 1 (concanavalin A-like superfamily)/uncharacterized protein (DUF2141 family)
MHKLSRQGGALLSGLVCALIAGSQPAAAQTSAMPSGWTSRDIGSPQVAGSAEGGVDTITVRGAGVDIGGLSDQFQFAYQATSGDVDIRLRIADLQGVNPGAKAGLMIRGSLTENAKHAFILVSAQEGLAFQWRSKIGRKSAQVSGARVAAPVWVRLVRQRNLFSAYSSATGAAWTFIGSANIAMDKSAYVGLAVTSHDPNQTATASFSSLAFGFRPSSSVPSPWAAGDVGSPALPGNASASGGTFTVTGAGADIWDTSDQFQFVYQPIMGDTDIVARVASLQAADVWSKAGVMIREALTGPAAHASLFTTGSNGWRVTRRLYAGGLTYSTPGDAGAAPSWVRLVREGNLFSAYQSQDGSQWTLVGTDTISMPATVYVGLAVTSHNTAATATATFSNVVISAPISSNAPPTVSLSGPAAGASYTAPANISISATAGDVDGSVTRVDFYADTQLVGSATASPFTVTWTNVPAGTYSLAAVATDNEDETATSAPISVTVATAPTNAPPTVSMSGPAPGASYTAPATISLSATAADVDGSVTRVDFYAGTQLVGSDTASPFTATWTNVAAGTYSLTAVATDNGGKTATSLPINVTVAAAPTPLPTKVVFVPPVDYATNVNSCTVELRRSSDVVTAVPVATRNLGKPAVVGGEISVDISTLVNPLPAGSYYAVVVSTGPGGSTPSTPSAVFSK